jgi:ribosomal protein S18 acetylase RimI-like enzyme
MSSRLAWVRTNADLREPWPALEELDAAAFGRHLDELTEVYAEAMGVPDLQLPGRRSVMEGHVVNPAFRAIVVTSPDDAGRPDAGRHDAGRQIVAFSYGFHGDRGQWWHDLVRSALTVRSGPGAAAAWLDDSFEVAEVHVRPRFQQRGIGRQMLHRLTGGLAERTAVLSTMDSESPARRLYRSLGFTDLLTQYQFAGVAESYAVMGAALLLLTARSPAGRPPSPRC